MISEANEEKPKSNEESTGPRMPRRTFKSEELSRKIEEKLGKKHGLA